MEVNVEFQNLIEQAQERASQSKVQADKDQAAVDTLQALVKQVDEEKQAFGKERYDVGFADGKASIVLPETGTGEKIYSQDEVNDIVNKVEAKKDEDAQAAADAKQKEFDAAQAEMKEELEAAETVKAERDQLLQDKQDDAKEMDALAADVDARIAAAKEVVSK